MLGGSAGSRAQIPPKSCPNPYFPSPGSIPDIWKGVFLPAINEFHLLSSIFCLYGAGARCLLRLSLFNKPWPRCPA